MLAGTKNAFTEYKNFEVENVKSEVENCHSVTLHSVRRERPPRKPMKSLHYTLLFGIFVIS